MSRSPISLIIQRVRAQGPIGMQTDARMHEHGDFYGDALHFVAKGERDSRRVMPQAPHAPQPKFGHLTRWDWLRLFSREWPAAVPAEDKAAGWPDFRQLLVPVDLGGVEPARHKVASAIELLAGLRDETAPLRRLMEIARPQKHTELGRKPEKRFVSDAWAGLYLLMEQCLLAAGSDWSEIDAACFPRLVVPKETSGESDITLRAWPDGYADWARKLEAIDDMEVFNNKTFNVLIPEALDSTWGLVLRLASSERRDQGDRKKRTGQEAREAEEVQDDVQAKLKKDWIRTVLDWRTVDAKDGEIFALSFRPKDFAFGRKSKQLGRVGTNSRELRHAIPLALLLAAMAADLHLARKGVALNKLGISMADSQPSSAGRSAPEYQDVWNRAAARLGNILRAEHPVPANPKRPPREVTRFAGTAPAAGSFVDGPVALLTPTFDSEDDGTVLLEVPLTALGADAARQIDAWEERGIACFGQAYQSITDELEDPFLVLVDDDWVAGSRSVSLRLEPRPDADTVLQRFWRGEIDPDDIELRAFVVDGGSEGEPRPVLYLQFVDRAL